MGRGRRPRITRRELAARAGAIRADDHARPIAPMLPDAARLPPLRTFEVITPPTLEARLINAHNLVLRVFEVGECHAIVTREYGAWHLSISHPRRYPTWDEVAFARYRLLPGDTWFAMYLPPPDRYVNLHRNVFQLYQCEDPGT